MSGEDQGAAPAAEAHATDNIHVETTSPEPLIVVKEEPAPAAATPAAEGNEGDTTSSAESAAGKPPKLPEWAQKKLNAAEAEKRIAERESKRLADELAALRAPKPEPAATTQADDAAARANAPSGGYQSKADFDAAVAQEADRRSAAANQQSEADKFTNRSNDVYNAGKAAFGAEFDNAAENLRAVGAMNKDMLDLVFETDAPEKVLYELGSDPDRAAAIIAMPPAKRAIEIAKMSVAAPQKATPTPLSNAPRPITPVDGSARVSAEPSDNDSDDVFFQKREAQLRAARG